MVSTGNIRKTCKKTRYGQTVFRRPRVYVKDRIIDDFYYCKTLINMAVEAKGRISTRRIGKEFRDATGATIINLTLVRKLKALEVLIRRRRYNPKLTKTHDWSR